MTVMNVATAKLAVEADVEAVLNGIIDPCSAAAGIPGGLIDMGLVRELRITPRPDGSCDVYVKICTTDPRCMMAAVFLNEVRQRLGTLIEPGDLEVELDHHTLWKPEMMAADYKVRLATRRERSQHAPATARVKTAPA